MGARERETTKSTPRVHTKHSGGGGGGGMHLLLRQLLRQGGQDRAFHLRQRGELFNLGRDLRIPLATIAAASAAAAGAAAAAIPVAAAWPPRMLLLLLLAGEAGVGVASRIPS
jgi:hypothetical protein